MSKKRSKRLDYQYTGSQWEFNKSFDEEVINSGRGLLAWIAILGHTI